MIGYTEGIAFLYTDQFNVYGKKKAEIWEQYTGNKVVCPACF